MENPSELKKYICHSVFYWDIFSGWWNLAALGWFFFRLNLGLARSAGCDGGEEGPRQSAQQVHRVVLAYAFETKTDLKPGDDHHEPEARFGKAPQPSWEQGLKGLADCGRPRGQRGCFPRAENEWRGGEVLSSSSLLCLPVAGP